MTINGPKLSAGPTQGLTKPPRVSTSKQFVSSITVCVTPAFHHLHDLLLTLLLAVNVGRMGEGFLPPAPLLLLSPGRSPAAPRPLFDVGAHYSAGDLWLVLEPLSFEKRSSRSPTPFWLLPWFSPLNVGWGHAGVLCYFCQDVCWLQKQCVCVINMHTYNKIWFHWKKQKWPMQFMSSPLLYMRR